jgi:hypothetical protein
MTRRLIETYNASSLSKGIARQVIGNKNQLRDKLTKMISQSCKNKANATTLDMTITDEGSSFE